VGWAAWDIADGEVRWAESSQAVEEARSFSAWKNWAKTSQI
jgi:hypothetical protein